MMYECQLLRRFACCYHLLIDDYWILTLKKSCALILRLRIAGPAEVCSKLINIFWLYKYYWILFNFNAFPDLNLHTVHVISNYLTHVLGITYKLCVQ